MPLETGDYIDDLVETNPTITDGVNQGDDHLRLVKKILKQALPGNTAPLTFVGDMDLNGDYNGTNATLTGTVTGNVIADGTYTLDQVGDRALQLNAVGQITGSTSVTGFGIIGVSQAGNGDFTVTFADPVASTHDQLVFTSADNFGFSTSAVLYAGNYHVNTTQARIFNVQITASDVSGFNAYPINIIRYLLV